MGRWLSALVVSGMIGCASLASAQSFALEWRAPSSCPNEAAMRSSIERLLADSQAAAAGVSAVGHVKRTGGHWTLQLTLDVQGRRATRALSAADCATLSDTAAWLVAVGLDPRVPAPTTPTREDPAAASSASGATSKEQDPARTATPDAAKGKPTASANAESSEDSREEERAAPSAITWHVGLFSGVLAAGLAGPNPSLGARASMEIDGLVLELSFAHHFATRMALTATPAGQSVFSAQELALAGCYAWGESVRVGPCAVLSGLRVQGDVERITQPQSASALWSTLGAALALSYRGFTPWELFIEGGLWLALSTRPRFEVQNIGSVGEAASVGGRVRLGVGMSLP